MTRDLESQTSTAREGVFRHGQDVDMAALAVDNVSITTAPTAFVKDDVSSDPVNGAVATATLQQDGFWRCRGVSIFKPPHPKR